MFILSFAISLSIAHHEVNGVPLPRLKTSSCKIAPFISMCSCIVCVCACVCHLWHSAIYYAFKITFYWLWCSCADNVTDYVTEKVFNAWQAGTVPVCIYFLFCCPLCFFPHSKAKKVYEGEETRTNHQLKGVKGIYPFFVSRAVPMLRMLC